jgi:hypothetical protein
MLKINVVLVNGKLVGKSVSDRWNLSMIGYNNGHDPIKGKAISQAEARRLAKGCDCVIVLHKADQTIKAHASKSEVSSLGRKLSKLLAWVA